MMSPDVGHETGKGLCPALVSCTQDVGPSTCDIWASFHPAVLRYLPALKPFGPLPLMDAPCALSLYRFGQYDMTACCLAAVPLNYAVCCYSQCDVYQTFNM